MKKKEKIAFFFFLFSLFQLFNDNGEEQSIFFFELFSPFLLPVIRESVLHKLYFDREKISCPWQYSL